MMNKYSLFLKSCILTLVSTISFTAISQQWEQIQILPATQNVFVAPNGNLISSDFQFDYSGGIHYSTDKGATWTKADVQDFAYTKMVQAGEYIVASGEGCNLARSKDNGVTWEVLNYGYMLIDYIGEEGVTYNVAYAITYFKDKLFVGDFGGGGVIYSSDFGETWTLTDRESLKYDLGVSKSTAKGDGTALDCYYNLAENNGELLLFGVYFVYRLNESDYTWELIRTDSNVMGVSASVNNNLICGRAIMNYNKDYPFLEYTADGGRSWSQISHADTITYDTNVRAMHSDNNGLFVGMQSGAIYYTTDMGTSWTDISKGLPNGSPTLILTSDNEYLYAAVYSEPWNTSSVSGIYRYEKANLPVASVNNTRNDQLSVYNYNNTLYVGATADITIYDANGKTIVTESNCNSYNYANLPNGIYLYKAISGTSQATGKFVK